VVKYLQVFRHVGFFILRRCRTVDAYTQPGASPNTLAVGSDAVLQIEINRAAVPGICSGFAQRF
jgi:hypothetical protein